MKFNRYLFPVIFIICLFAFSFVACDKGLNKPDAAAKKSEPIAKPQPVKPAATPVVQTAPTSTPEPQALDFNAMTREGKNVKLSDFRGKVSLVMVWASWCGYCRKALPEINKEVPQFKNHGAQVLALNADMDKNDAEKYLKTNIAPVHVTVLYDPNGEGRNALGVRGFPAFFVLDAKGRIAYNIPGYGPGLVDHLLQVIDKVNEAK